MNAVERLRALHEAASRGPWGPATCRDVSNPDNDPAWEGSGFLGWEIPPLEPPGRGLIEHGYDAALIVAAVNALPALLDELEHRREAMRIATWCEACESTGCKFDEATS